MPSRARVRHVAKARMALETAVNEDAWTTSVPEALGYLTPFASTMDERDALIELQLSVSRLCRAAHDGPVPNDQLTRLSEAWFVFDEVWLAATGLEEHRVSTSSPVEDLGSWAPRQIGG